MSPTALHDIPSDTMPYVSALMPSNWSAHLAIDSLHILHAIPVIRFSSKSPHLILLSNWSAHLATDSLNILHPIPVIHFFLSKSPHVTDIQIPSKSGQQI